MARNALQAINSHLPRASGSAGRSEQRAQGGAGRAGAAEGVAGDAEIEFGVGGATRGSGSVEGANPAGSAAGRVSSKGEGSCVVLWDIPAIRLLGKGAAGPEATPSKSHRMSRQPCRQAAAVGRSRDVGRVTIAQALEIVRRGRRGQERFRRRAQGRKPGWVCRGRMGRACSGRCPVPRRVAPTSSCHRKPAAP